MKISSKFRFLSSPARRLAAVMIFSAAFFSAVLLLCARDAAAAPTANSATRSLLIYSIDVEGGQATLLVSEPSRTSLLVDTGWPGFNGRDAERIQAAMHDAGITRIDHLLITHYHADHVGGVPNLVQRVQVGEFLDHGPNRESDPKTVAGYEAYLKAIAGKPHRVVHPGDHISIPGLSIIVVAADGEHVHQVFGIPPAPNPYCASEKHWPVDQTENARSSGILVRLGKFSFLDLGDLTGAKEVALVCPNNPLGTVDLYLVTHHGMNLSNSRAIVNAIQPRVAIMNNGAHKAGMPEAWQNVHDSPRHPDLYQLHTAEGSDAAHNSPEALIANPKGATEDGAYFKVVAKPDSSFSVTNTRTGQTKQYGPAK